MSGRIQLNNVEHNDLRIITERSRALGDGVMHCATYAYEFRSVQAHYPIFFHKDQKGGFQAVALLGFEKGENLFLTEAGWDAHYLPHVMEMQPFLIGFHQGAGGAPQAEIHIDINHPRCSRTEGEPVFLERGGQSDYLKRIAKILDAVHHAHQTSHAFMEALTALDLLEPFALDIELNDGSKNRLAGFYTINEEKLLALKADQLAGLNQRNFLLPVYMAVASISNVRDLVERKNKRVAAAQA